MGEQTILCGMLQTGAVLNFEKMVANGIDAGYASKLIQYGWETITEALKHGGITGMMDRLDNPSKMKAYELAEELKDIMRPLYEKHQNDIITGAFSSGMMADWDNDDANLLKWRAETAETGFEKQPAGDMEIAEQEYFDNAVLMVAQVKAGVELAFEQMVRGHEARERVLRVAARDAAHRQHDRAAQAVRDELGHLGHGRVRLLPLRPGVQAAARRLHGEGRHVDVIGKKFNSGDNGVDNRALNAVNKAIRDHPVEVIGRELRGYMTAMEKIAAGEKRLQRRRRLVRVVRGPVGRAPFWRTSSAPHIARARACIRGAPTTR